MTATTAQPSCLTGAYELDPTAISQGQLDQVTRGTNALLGMRDAVSAVARVGGQIGMAVAAELAQQQQF